MGRSREPGGLSGASRRDLAILFGAGRRTVTVEAAAEALGLSPEAAARRLSALASRGWLRRVRRGLYLAVPVDAPNPAAWTDDPWYLADLVWNPCYIAGWSAANHWSLTDQVFRSTVVATTQRVRRVEQELAGANYLLHHVGPECLTWGLVGEWRHDRRVLVSNPERTVADLLSDPALEWRYPPHDGDPRRRCWRTRASRVLWTLCDRLGNGAGLKRLGYLLEVLGHDVGVIDQPMTSGVSLLDPSLPARGPRSSHWGLRVNADVSA